MPSAESGSFGGGAAGFEGATAGELGAGCDEGRPFRELTAGFVTTGSAATSAGTKISVGAVRARLAVVVSTSTDVAIRALSRISYDTLTSMPFQMSPKLPSLSLTTILVSGVTPMGIARKPSRLGVT